MSVNTPLRSPNWSTPTKVFVASVSTILLAMAVWYFQSVIGPLVIAGVIAYILNPVIAWLDNRTPMSRGLAIGLVYLLFALIVVGLLTAASVTIYQQMAGLIDVVQEVISLGPAYFNDLMNRTVQIGPWSFQASQFDLDFSDIWQQLASAIQPMLSQSAQFVTAAASTTAGWIGWSILVYVLSIYFAIDWPRLGNAVSDAIHQPGYRHDAQRLMAETGRIWNSYLRGQTILAVLMGILFTVILWILGVRYALVLGILAGVLDFIPFVGAFITVTLSTAVAIFQGDNWLGLDPIWFGLIVLVIGLVLQQIEGNWLNPRIVGGALGLHPLLVMVGAIMGSILAGILGVMLAAPVIATIKLIGTYAWRKMFDLDPFPEADPVLKREPQAEPEPQTRPPAAPETRSPEPSQPVPDA